MFVLECVVDAGVCWTCGGRVVAVYNFFDSSTLRYSRKCFRQCFFACYNINKSILRSCVYYTTITVPVGGWQKLVRVKRYFVYD